jgi:hypothetical protein
VAEHLANLSTIKKKEREKEGKKPPNHWPKGNEN